MRINGEPVELVTDFAQLRAGMIVWIKGCFTCRESHRHILTSPERCEHGIAPGIFAVGPIWNALPPRKCRPFAEPVISEDTVSRKCVYRVVDPLLDAQTTERKRETVHP